MPILTFLSKILSIPPNDNINAPNQIQLTKGFIYVRTTHSNSPCCAPNTIYISLEKALSIDASVVVIDCVGKNLYSWNLVVK